MLTILRVTPWRTQSAWYTTAHTALFKVCIYQGKLKTHRFIYASQPSPPATLPLVTCASSPWVMVPYPTHSHTKTECCQHLGHPAAGIQLYPSYLALVVAHKFLMYINISFVFLEKVNYYRLSMANLFFSKTINDVTYFAFSKNIQNYLPELFQNLPPRTSLDWLAPL